jgi:hypothetical protein
MGKRELVLIVAFLVLGAVVYQVSAPDASQSGARRPWSDVFREIRAEMFGARARFPVDLPVRVPVSASVKTLDLGELSGRVEIVGEGREDIEGTAHATLVGEDEADVKRAAGALEVAAEEDGDRLRLRLSHPEEWRLGRHGRPPVDLRVKVPARLTLRLGVSGVTEARGIAGVSLDSARGTVTLKAINGPVEGGQRDGTLDVSGARSVDIETRRVTVRLQEIDGTVEVDATDGGLEAVGLKGKTTLTTRRASVQLTDQAGPVEIEGGDGRAEVRGLSAELAFDGTRLPLIVELATPAPVTADSSDGAVELRLPRGGVTLKISVEEGSLVVPPGLPEAVRTGSTSTLEAKVDGGGPLLSLSGSRAAVTVKAPQAP